MQREIQLQISVADGYSIKSVARELVAQGLTKQKILKEINVIVGAAAAEAVERLKKVKGVKAVDKQPQIDIGRPEGNDTW